MSLSRNALNTLIASAFALSLGGVSKPVAFAAETEDEKCYSIAKAGHNACAAEEKEHTCAAQPTNDCASSANFHSCAGLSKMNGAGNDFLLLPKGLCAKIAGSSMSITEAPGTVPVVNGDKKLK